MTFGIFLCDFWDIFEVIYPKLPKCNSCIKHKRFFLHVKFSTTVNFCSTRKSWDPRFLEANIVSTSDYNTLYSPTCYIVSQNSRLILQTTNTSSHIQPVQVHHRSKSYCHLNNLINRWMLNFYYCN